MPELLVNIDVADLDAAVAFYTAGLGLTVGCRLGPGVVELLGAPAPIFLLTQPRDTAPFAGAESTRSYQRHWTPVHLDFPVDALEPAIERARAAGATLEGSIRSFEWGRIAVLADPFGHGFCLLQFSRRGYAALESSQRTNEYGQPIGDAVPDWTSRPRPPRTPMIGRLCRLEPLDAEAHADALHEAYAADRDGRHWTYLPYGPFDSAAGYRAFVESVQSRDDPLFFAIVDRATQRPVGVASYLRVDPALGTIEVGHLRFAAALQRTPAATEAMYLMMRRAFDELGYRRYEWKCDSLNAPSIAAAKRLGFQYEGTFRQAVVMKGRNRDTAWLSILDREWPARRAAMERWLDPANFDATGAQRRSLGSFAAVRAE